MTEYIRKQVRKLVLSCKTRDPASIAEKLGINLWYRDLGGLKGFYLYERKSRYIIVNERLDSITAQVVIAHELGHHMLHKELSAGGIRENTMFLDGNKTERQANLFAAELLIADEKITELVYDGCTVEQLSAALCTLPEIIEYKLEMMNGKGFSFRQNCVRSDFLK